MATIIEGVTNGTAKIALSNFICDQLYRPRAQASGNPTTTVNSVDSVASSIVNSRALSVFSVSYTHLTLPTILLV